MLLLDGLQDPGNLGTILRTAEAFALGAPLCCARAAPDPFSPKVVRSTMGAVFRLPCVTLRLRRRRTAAQKRSAAVRHRADGGERAAFLVSLSKAAAIIGSEGKGVTEQALRLSDRRVIIPMKGRAESLNAGVAAAIVIYEMTK